MSEELKPCPFCGSNNVGNASKANGSAVTCFDCNCEGAFIYDDDKHTTQELEDKAIAAWNTRSGPAWQDKPTCAGRWLFDYCTGDPSETVDVYEGNLRDWQESEILAGCYGPIPERPIPDDAGGVT